MGSSKKQTTQNTYQHIPTPNTPDIDRTRASIDKLKGRINPVIKGQYAAARRDLDGSFQNPMGPYTTPAMREATLNAGRNELGQQEALAIQGAEFDADNAEFGRNFSLAQLTAPRLVQTGGTTTQSGGFLGDLALGAVGGFSRAAGDWLMNRSFAPKPPSATDYTASSAALF